METSRFVSIVCFLFLLLAALAQAADPLPNVPWLSSVDATLVPSMSDEFDGPLDHAKWSVNGIENPDTKCPRWNGPPSWGKPEYSVYFATSTDPSVSPPQEHTFKSYEVKDGALEFQLKQQDPSFFSAREYYCNSTTFRCNHNPSIPCYPTKFNGEPAYRNKAKGTYWGVVHDKCKIEPYCIPSPEHVTRKSPVYNGYVGPHLTTRDRLRYGFVEARIRVPDSSAIVGVWMHSDQYTNGYCRYRKKPDDRWNKLECPSAIRSRTWGEIDIAEAMNSQLFKNKYIPNLHFFSDNKGEFSDAEANKNEDGGMGGGPIVLLKGEFNLANPSFSNVPQNQRVGNDWHYNPGSVGAPNGEWASDWQTVGMYWSPKEIRWYLNGNEVRRISNKLIHIPMNIDLTYALNLNWAREPPPANQADLRAKIDYVRVWKIATDEGAEVPFTKPWLDMRMHTNFKNLYGNEMGGVFGVFPQMDSYSTFPLDQASGRELLNVTEAEQLFLNQTSVGQRGNNRRTRRQARRERKQQRRQNRRERRRKRRLQAGGPGNRRRLRRLKRRSRKLLRILLSSPDRIARIDVPGLPPRTLKNAEFTILDDVDPMSAGAGFTLADSNGDVPTLSG